MAIYEILNYGPERRIPWKEPLNLLAGSRHYTEDAELAEHVGKFSKISVKKVSGAKPAPASPSYEKMSMPELHKEAGKRGVGGFGLKMKDLIKRLREVT